MSYRPVMVGAVLLALTSCSPGAKSSGPESGPPRPEDATAFLLGTWKATEAGGPEEHWVIMAGAAYGVTLFAEGFELMIIDEDPPRPGAGAQHLTMLAMPGGRPPVRFRAESIEGSLARFGNPDHDFPTWIQYEATGPSGLRAQVGGPGRDPIVVNLERTDEASAPEIEEADRVFDRETATGGGAAWARHFAPDGAMLASGDRRIEGQEAIEAHMTPALEEHELRWTPRASGRRDDTGFTVGQYTLTRRADGARVDRGSYATIWQRQADGTWAVIFDAGRPDSDRP